MSKVFDLGAFTAYAIAVEHGYEGTEEEWIEAHERARVEAERSAKSAYDYAVSAGSSADVAGSMKNAAVQASEIAVSAKDSSVQSANEAHASAQSAEVAKNAAETAQRGASVSENNAKSSETAAAKSSADASTFKDDALEAKQGAETARDDAISAKNEAVSSKEQVHSDRVAAENAKTDAETAKTSAEAAQKAAESAKKSVDASVQSVTAMRDEVSTLKQSAFEAKEAAETAKTGAESARDEAVQAKTDSESAKSGAITAKEAAETAQRLAEEAKTGADSAKTAAEEARDGAVTAKESADTAKTAALGAQSAAETAKSGAETAQGKAEAAESNAKTYAEQAETAKFSAETSAQSAGQSATNADTFAKKAQGLVDSLPTDFTAVQNEVSQLKDDLEHKQNIIENPNLTSGAVRQGTKDDMSALLSYIATSKASDVIPCKSGDKFVLSVVSEIPVSLLLGTTSNNTEQFSWIDLNGWVEYNTVTITATADGYVRYCLRAKDLSTPIANHNGFVVNVSVELKKDVDTTGVFGIVENGGVKKVATLDEFNYVKQNMEINSVNFVYDLFSNKSPDAGTMTTSGVRTDGAYAGYKHYKVNKNELAGNQIVIDGTFSGTAFDTVFFYDSEDELVGKWSSPIGTEKDNGRLISVSEFPKKTDYFIINVFLNYNAHAYQYLNGIDTRYISLSYQFSKKLGISRWYGKKVVWLGTSISFGQHAETTSYAYTAADILGFNLINTSFPGISLDVDSDTDTLSSALSIAEQASRGLIIPDSPSGYYPQHGMPNDYYRTYEHIFSEENSDADLYVYAVLPNNRNWERTDWDAFDKVNWRYNDNSDFASHRGTFLGALIFMMDKMYESNPNARMVFCVDLDGYSYTNGLPLIEEVSEAFGIPIINLWKKVQYNPKTMSLIRYSDGIHLNDYAHIHMGKMMSGEMLLIN